MTNHTDREATGDFVRLRDVAALEAVIGEAWCSGRLSSPQRDVLAVRFRRGGLLVLAPEVVRPWNMGRMRLRRPDGLLICTSGEMHPVVPVELGTVLGPFVPGEHTFEVWLGNRRLPDVSATVRAGRTTPLVIP